MNTLADIIDLGNAEALAGKPLVYNWPQTRGALLMFGKASGGLDKFKIEALGDWLPEHFDALDPVTQDLLPNAWCYSRIRELIWKLLAVTGKVEDPWEQLRIMIRNAGRHDIELLWSGLKTPAVEAGLRPSQIHSDWVWSLDAEQGVLTDTQLQDRKAREAKHGAPDVGLARSVRQRLRRSVALFDELFEITEIAASGVLPTQPIGPPPTYDRMGRRKISLPEKLADCQARRPDQGLQGLPQVWQAICASGIFELSEDPSPDDLLSPDTWDRIMSLPNCVTGYTASTWHVYLARTRATLRSHCSLPPANAGRQAENRPLDPEITS
jgi:hypothetical protein